MPKQIYANNAKGRLNAGITNIATTLTLNAGQGTLFPNPVTGRWFMFTLIKSDGSIEICKCTARSGDVFSTIVRAQEGTASFAFNANDRVELRLTKGSMEWWKQQGQVETITGDITLTVDDIGITHVVTAEADIILPAASALLDNDEIWIKSMTEALVTITTQGADIHDGDGAASLYQLPSFSSVKAVRINAGAFVYLQKPETYVGQTEFYPSTGATPKGYVLGEGAPFSRTTLSGLFAVYGTTHGAGDGSTTFNVPDFKGRVAMGAGLGTDVEAVVAANVDAGADTFLVASNDDKWITAKKVQLTTTDTLPAGLALATDYWIVRTSATLIKFASTLANAQNGTVINITNQGVGTHTLTHSFKTRTVGQKGGEEAHAESSAEQLLHTHVQNSHTHPVQTGTGSGVERQVTTSASAEFALGGPSVSAAATATTATNQNTGGNAAMNITNPFLAGKWIIKT